MMDSSDLYMYVDTTTMQPIKWKFSWTLRSRLFEMWYTKAGKLLGTQLYELEKLETGIGVFRNNTCQISDVEPVLYLIRNKTY